MSFLRSIAHNLIMVKYFIKFVCILYDKHESNIKTEFNIEIQKLDIEI